MTLLAGSYRQDDALQLFDIRNMKCVRTYEWDGIDGGKTYLDKNNEVISQTVDDLDNDEEHM